MENRNLELNKKFFVKSGSNIQIYQDDLGFNSLIRKHVTTDKLKELYQQMTPQEKKEIETFAIFLLTRRKLRKRNILTDDIRIEELIQLLEESGSFDWLNSKDEDVYSVNDGEAVKWSPK